MKSKPTWWKTSGCSATSAFLFTGFETVITGGDQWIQFDPFLYRPIRRKPADWQPSPGTRPTPWTWRRSEPVSSIAAIQKTAVAPLRGSPRRPRHRQRPPGRLPPGRGGGQRRPLRRGQLAARVRPLPGRLGQSRVGLRAPLPQAHRHHVPHASDRTHRMPRRIIQNLAAHSQGIVVMTKVAARLLERVYHVSGAKVQVIPHGVPEVPYQRDGSHKTRLGLCRPAGDLHLRTDQSRQGTGIHDSGHAPDRRRLPGGLVPDRGRHPPAGQAAGG